MITLLVARHGNTFDPGDTILRVGKQTDFPLSKSGCEQAKKLGVFLKEKYTMIDHVMVSQLQRTQQTAHLALPDIQCEINSFLDEIDYGVDDGKPEFQVVERLGETALKAWEENAVPPEGWKVQPENIIQGWQRLAQQCVNDYSEQQTNTTILIVTSNGIARFAPSIVDEQMVSSHKMKTGAVSAFQFTQDKRWLLDYWNLSV